MEYVQLAGELLKLVLKLVDAAKAKDLLDNLEAVQKANEEADRLEAIKFPQEPPG